MNHPAYAVPAVRAKEKAEAEGRVWKNEKEAESWERLTLSQLTEALTKEKECGAYTKARSLVSQIAYTVIA